MSIDDAMRYATNPCELFIAALQEVADLIGEQNTVSSDAVWEAIQRHLGGKNWYSKYTWRGSPYYRGSAPSARIINE